MLWAVELRREESRCQLQDLIRPAQLPILRTKLPHFRGFHTRRPRPSARVHLRLSHPVVDGLRRPDPKFRRHRLNGRPLRSMLRPNLRHHPNSTVPQLLRVAPRSSRHDPILPKRRSLRQTRGDSRCHCGTHLVLRLQSPSEIEVNLTLLGPVRVHHHDPHTMLGLTRQTGNGVTVSFVRTADGQLFAATTGSSSAYYLTDNVGSTVGIVNSSGVKTAAYGYDPYGRTRTATGGAAANAFRYASACSTTPPAPPNSVPESPRVCRRLRLLGRMGSCREDLGATRRSCGTVLFGWWRRFGRSMLRSGRPLSRWRRNLGSGLRRPSTTG